MSNPESRDKWIDKEIYIYTDDWGYPDDEALIRANENADALELRFKGVWPTAIASDYHENRNVNSGGRRKRRKSKKTRKTKRKTKKSRKTRRKSTRRR